jgi:hypothetical protein
MENPAERFEELFQRWSASSETGLRSLSSSSSSYTENPEFEAIVDMGEAAVPYIIAKLETDAGAHFLINALEKLTNKRFTPEEVEAAERLYGKPLGNQGYARMWIDWWKQLKQK